MFWHLISTRPGSWSFLLNQSSRTNFAKVGENSSAVLGTTGELADTLTGALVGFSTVFWGIFRIREAFLSVKLNAFRYFYENDFWDFWRFYVLMYVFASIFYAWCFYFLVLSSSCLLSFILKLLFIISVYYLKKNIHQVKTTENLGHQSKNNISKYFNNNLYFLPF